MSVTESVTEGGMLPVVVRVLVVDDDVQICSQMASGLASAGYQVVTANDAETAYAHAAPDVAIVDLGMPTSGLEIIRRLKHDHGAAVYVIVLTGHDDESSRTAAFEAGCNDYVIKPVPMSELRRRVSAAARTQQAFVGVRLEKEATERRLVYGQEAAALLAHDLNNGLAVSLSNLSYLVETLQCDDEQRDALAAMLRSVRRMSGLVANFVDISRFEDAAVKPKTQRAVVREVLASVVEVNAPSGSRGAKLEIDCDPALAGRFDVGLIERVLHNLFGNATRYCNPNGKIVIAARAQRAGEDSIEISVRNTGPQIPEDIRGNLFGKYVRGKGGRRGMGLYFCRLVAEAHGGTIAYEAHPEGPSFVLRLPGRA